MCVIQHTVQGISSLCVYLHICKYLHSHRQLICMHLCMWMWGWVCVTTFVDFKNVYVVYMHLYMWACIRASRFWHVWELCKCMCGGMSICVSTYVHYKPIHLMDAFVWEHMQWCVRVCMHMHLYVYAVCMHARTWLYKYFLAETLCHHISPSSNSLPSQS